MSTVWPTEIRLSKDKRTLHVAFDDGAAFDLTAEYLRTQSPSAEVQGHAASERKTVPGKSAVEIIGVEPVGNYAVRLVFDDMHQTGLFSWTYLRELGDRHDEKWAAYLAELAQKGLSRDPVRRR
ncbi:gamma-butyrobetaine hydroxylase family protein [Alsobacter sp. SYSU BS001988]